MSFNELEILEDEFDLFVALDHQEKIEFLFDAAEQGIEDAVVKQVDRLEQKFVRKQPIIQTDDWQVANGRICVTLTKNRVYVNSSSLKAIRNFTNKMINDGLMLWPSNEKKTKYDLYKYFKSYQIIARGTPLSSN
tara:strand:+ start:84 stop:488 length:405 start_codon:yes stop_codon:yes gene_type:complete